MPDDPDDEPQGLPSPEGQAARPPRRRRWRRWVLAVLALLTVVGIVLVAAAPAYIERLVRERLAQSWGADVKLDRIEVRWTRMQVHLHGLQFDDGVRLRVDVERVEADLSWSDLVRGSVRPELLVVAPRIRFRVEPAGEQTRSQRGLEAFESVDVVDGTLEVVIATGHGPAVVSLTEIEARIDARLAASPTARMDLTVEASATVGEHGHLHASGRMSSRTPAEAWSFRFELRQFALASLNTLWLDLVEMDVERGQLAVDGDLMRTPKRLRGRIRPQFEDIALLGANEEALHPMAEALFGHMLMGSRSTMSIDRAMTEDRRSSLPELLETDWQTIIQDVIKRGYARRLSTLRGFRATIGDVRVDFGEGLLQLMDVVVDAESPVIETPVVAIERVDVVFDAEVTSAGTPAYKHVTLWKPTLTFATGVEGSETKLQFDETWIDTISAIPFATRDLIVHDGRIDVWDFRGAEVVNVFVSDIELEGREMASDLHLPGVRGAELSGTGLVLGEAPASIRMVYEPRASPPNLDADMLLEPVELTTLAPVLQAFAEVDAVGGRVGLSAHLDARNYEVEASVVPEVHRPQLRTIGGRRIRKLLLSRALRHLRSHTIDLHYTMEPGDGPLHSFFLELVQAIFFRR
ncbi:MAG: AsmA family protein [Deltaproteobacteria bacterium]|nr:AsmA family protein [Deltaproteobacteria bacterium]